MFEGLSAKKDLGAIETIMSAGTCLTLETARNGQIAQERTYDDAVNTPRHISPWCGLGSTAIDRNDHPRRRPCYGPYGCDQRFCIRSRRHSNQSWRFNYLSQRRQRPPLCNRFERRVRYWSAWQGSESHHGRWGFRKVRLSLRASCQHARNDHGLLIPSARDLKGLPVWWVFLVSKLRNGHGR